MEVNGSGGPDDGSELAGLAAELSEVIDLAMQLAELSYPPELRTRDLVMAEAALILREVLFSGLGPERTRT